MNNISLFLTAIGGSIQSFETAAQQVLTQRTIDTAVGQQLDEIGFLVGEPRSGLDDDTYRRRVRARISVHRSNGLVSDIIKVTALIVFDDASIIRVESQDVLTVVVHVENAVVSNPVADIALLAFLLKTVAASVRVILHSGTSLPATWFRLDTGPGLDAGIFTDSRG